MKTIEAQITELEAELDVLRRSELAAMDAGDEDLEMEIGERILAKEATLAQLRNAAYLVEFGDTPAAMDMTLLD